MNNMSVTENTYTLFESENYSIEIYVVWEYQKSIC